MIMRAQDIEYDVYVSYAREDGAWVRRNLYEPLLRCRTAVGQKPHVFLDVDTAGVPPSVSFMPFLAETIARSRTVVAVYSTAYFSSEMCNWELTQAAQSDPAGREGKLTPILLEPAAGERVPLHVGGIHYIDAARNDWFEILRASLRLTTPEEPLELAFLDPPEETTIHHTLPPLRVAMTRDGETEPRTGAVTVTLEGGLLTGTTSVEAVDGVAVFDDLAVGTARESARLVATAEGCLPAHSRAFAVHAAPEPAPAAARAVIPGSGEAVFFADDQAVALFAPDHVAVHDLTGRRLCRLDDPRPPRLLRRHDAALAVASWSGRVDLLTSAGEHHRWELAPASGDYAIPGDLRLDGGEVLVGLWSGRVLRLVPGRDAAVVLDHPAGVERLAVVGDRLAVCGFDGGLVIYRGERRVRSHQLEPGIRLLEVVPGGLLAVGEAHLFRVALDTGRVLTEELPLADVAEVLADSECPVLVDRRGRAVVIDAELAVRASFHAGAGAVPIAADRAARRCVLAEPDGSRSLVEMGAGARRGAVTFSARGTLAPSLSGELFALGGEAGTRILTAADMRQLVGDAVHA